MSVQSRTPAIYASLPDVLAPISLFRAETKNVTDSLSSSKQMGGVLPVRLRVS